jgi:Arm DNA-binding domain
MPRPNRSGAPASAPNKRKLTAIFMQKMKPQARHFMLWDAMQRGLALRVEPTGYRGWKVVYRHHGRPRWYHLGAADAIGLADARTLAAEVMLQVARGKDPQAERKAQRTAGTFEDLATPRVAVIRDPSTAVGLGQFGAIQAVAPSLGVEVSPINLRDVGEIEPAIAAFVRPSHDGLIVTGSPLALGHRDLIFALAARYKLPAVYPARFFAAALDQFRRAAGYVDRILKGEKPADLPVQAPTLILLSVVPAKAVSRRLIFLAIGLVLLIALNGLSKLAPKLHD